MLSKLFDSTSTGAVNNGSVQPAEEPAPSEIGDITPETSIVEDVDSVDPVEPVGEEMVDLPPAAETELGSESPSETDIAAVRELILASHPTIVPELITGDSIDALIASIEPAQAAYSPIVSNVSIPAGGNAPVTLDVESLPTFDKIRRGIANPRS